jgi:hypothetical protein
LTLPAAKLCLNVIYLPLDNSQFLGDLLFGLGDVCS